MEFDGAAFCEKGVILVTVEYRVNAFGFLAHPWLSEESGVGRSGNYAILDQIAALKWVKENIAAFGGDPENNHRIRPVRGMHERTDTRQFSAD